MKEKYISPQSEVIRMDCRMAPICVSGLDYLIEAGVFDPDSDSDLSDYQL